MKFQKKIPESFYGYVDCGFRESSGFFSLKVKSRSETEKK